MDHHYKEYVSGKGDKPRSSKYRDLQKKRRRAREEEGESPSEVDESMESNSATGQQNCEERRSDYSGVTDDETNSPLAMRNYDEHRNDVDVVNDDDMDAAPGTPNSRDGSDHSNYTSDTGESDDSADDPADNRSGNARDSPDLERLKKYINQEENNEVIKTNVAVSKVEILLAVLKYSITYSLSQTAMADLFLLISTILGVDTLPSTRYHIDKLFNNPDNVTYHACCPECKKYVSEISKDTRRLECRHCKHDINVKSPTYNEFFAIIRVDSEIATLLEMNWEHYKRTIGRTEFGDHVSDLTDARLYIEFVRKLPPELRLRYATVLFNTDGASIFDSSSYSIWPIQLSVNEIPYDVRTANLLTCGIWFGRGKPDMDIFLKQFVKQMNGLGEAGVDCVVNGEKHNIKIFPVCSCVDSQARAPMQNIKACGGHFGCNWCYHPGVYIGEFPNGAIKFPLLNEEISDRTEEETIEIMEEVHRTGIQDRGVKGRSWLTNLLYFCIILGFVPDYMHMLCLGVAKRFLETWLTVLTAEEISRIESLMKKIKVPNNVQRFSRGIKDMKYWKAREWENWLLFYSLPIIKSFPRLSHLAEHWGLLVGAIHILMQKTIPIDEIVVADDMLKRFVVQTEVYYHKSAMTHNLHQLLHLAQSVIDWGPLWAHSGYCFESNNKFILDKIHSARGVISQICRSVSLKQSELILRRHVALKRHSPINRFLARLNHKTVLKTCKLSSARYFGCRKTAGDYYLERFNLSTNSYIYSKMVKERCKYGTKSSVSIRSNNSYAKLTNGSYIQILKFIVDESNNLELTLCDVLSTGSAMGGRESPLKKVVGVSEKNGVVETNEIESVCVPVSIEGDVYLTAPPNLYHN